MAETPASKRAYHHGDLKEALIDAAHCLIQEKGVEGFTLADASRMAGVSAAAPYRHFADRQALIDAVAEKGFVLLSVRTRDARDAYEKGTEAAIIAMGQAYVRFAENEPALFRLMFGRHVAPSVKAEANFDGQLAISVLLDAVAAYLEAHPDLPLGIWDIAVPLWSMVHGTANLIIDRNFEAVVPDIDPDGAIEAATRAYFAGLKGGVG